MRTKALAIASLVALVELIARAQGTPAGPNLKEVLFDAANALGLLRGLQQQDSITTVEYWATGTMNVGGQLGNTVTQTTFSNYGELNDLDYRADVFFPRHIVRTEGGVPVLDLTITRTNTLNPYVIIPVPDTIEKAAAAQRPAAPLH